MTVYDCAALMPYSRRLAAAYILPLSREARHMTLQDMCQYNAQVIHPLPPTFCFCPGRPGT